MHQELRKVDDGTLFDCHRSAKGRTKISSSNVVPVQYWDRVATGVILAGVVYPPLALSFGYLIASIQRTGTIRLPPAEEFLFAIPFTVAACFCTLLVTVPTAYVILLFVCKVSEILDMSSDVIRISLFAGGLCGLAISSPLVWAALTYEGFFWGLGMSMLATLTCQFGAALSSCKFLSKAQALELCIQSVWIPRFRLKHLAWCAILLSVLLAVLKISGTPMMETLLFLVAWFVCQAISSRLVVLLIKLRAALTSDDEPVTHSPT